MAEFANARYIDPDNGRIDMELNHRQHGWIPITIVPDEYPELWAEVVATGTVAPYAPPAPEA